MNTHNNQELFDALEKGNIKEVQKLINTETVNVRNEKGMTPLMLAAQKDHVDIVKLLLREGADPNVKKTNSGYTALHFATNYKTRKIEKEVIKELLLYGADPNQKSKSGQPPTIYTKKLLEMAGDLNLNKICSFFPRNRGMKRLNFMLENGVSLEEASTRPQLDSDLLREIVIRAAQHPRPDNAGVSTDDFLNIMENIIKINPPEKLTFLNDSNVINKVFDKLKEKSDDPNINQRKIQLLDKLTKVKVGNVFIVNSTVPTFIKSLIEGGYRQGVKSDKKEGKAHYANTNLLLHGARKAKEYLVSKVYLKSNVHHNTVELHRRNSKK